MQTAERVRKILSTRGLTLYQVSRRSAEIFGRSSLYFIPQRLYHELEIGAFKPNIHQLAALSRISNYCLSDWLVVFGFRLDDIPRLQLLIPGGARSCSIHPFTTESSGSLGWPTGFPPLSRPQSGRWANY